MSVTIKGTWNEEATLPIKCPECGQTNDKRITALIDARECVCAGCGKTIAITGDGLEVLEGLKDMIESFR